MITVIIPEWAFWVLFVFIAVNLGLAVVEFLYRRKLRKWPK